MTSIFDEIETEADNSLKSGNISDLLVNNCSSALNEFSEFSKKSMTVEDTIIGLKLYSASNTSKEILQEIKQKLADAKIKGENPTTLERFIYIIFMLTDIGNSLTKTFATSNFNTDMIDIREKTFELQDVGEKENLIESSKDKLRTIGEELKQAIISNTEIEQ